MHRHLITILAALAAAAITAGVVIASRHRDPASSRSPGSYAIGLWGDLPYSERQRTVGVPKLIADMNRQHLAFSVHDGDIKSGIAPCVDSVYTRFKALVDTLDAPAMFTPGDNDWTDCDRLLFNSKERLNFERRQFFSTPYSFGRHKLKQEVQEKPYVENRRWTVGRVTYATFNVQGSCNNLCDVAPDRSEYAARNKADIRWLHETFSEAKSQRSAAVMIVFQADPDWEARDPKTLKEADGNPDGFHGFLSALRDETIAFRRPVVAMHGDSHYFRIDKPLENSAGQRLENFTRVETFGEDDVNWLKVTVDPSSREVFSYQPQIVPANRTAVPSP
jgi:hypothetical protein